MSFFWSENQSKKILRKKIGKGNTFTARAFFNKKKKWCEKSSSIYKSRKKWNKNKNLKKTGIKLELSSRIIAENRENNATKNEKIKRLPFGARSLKNYYFTAAVKKQNSVFFSRKKPNVVQCVNQFHEIFSSITIIIPAVRYNRCYATIVPFI